MDSHKLFLLQKFTTDILPVESESKLESKPEIPIDDFPYKKLILTDDEMKTKFNNLKHYRPNLVYTRYKVFNIDFLKQFLYKGIPTILEKKYSDYEDYNILSDYFQEFCRMKCQRYDTDISPYNYWEKNKHLVIKFSEKKYNKTDPHSLRESLYEMTHECTSFRPTIMVSMIKMFYGKVILDFSAGWGDRLLGALACDDIIDFYCGVDPNTCVHPNYQKMIQFFNKDSKKYHMINKPFQEADIPDKGYNLIMTSPPYFTLEKYSEEDTQSIKSFSSLKDWLENFLFYSLNKSWNLLKSGGHMVISINDMRGDEFKYVEKMINYVKDKLKGSQYLGVISYAEKKGKWHKSPQPLWIWKKNLI